MARRGRDSRWRRRMGAATAAGMLFACLALGARASASGGAEPQVVIQDFRFEPATLEVPAGATVTWVNHDEEIHTVTSAQGLFTSPALDGDQRFSYRFETPGTYEYRCALHPPMRGNVVVR